ncbi:IS701 family transposase [Nocardia beijingensis]
MLGERIDSVRPVIEEFASEMFAGFACRDQRMKGQLYLRGLLTDGKRKSMQPMAARLGIDHQQLQQFVTTSTWDHTEVRARLTGWAARFVDPDALVIDDTGFPKDGIASPGVARMYCGALGKRGNCQIGVSVHAVTDWASAAVNWRLYLPSSWDDRTATDPAEAAHAATRRSRCAIPDEARFREKWRLALDMLDEVLTWGMPARPVTADAVYGDSTAFRAGLTDRGLNYVLAVSASTSVHPAAAVPVPPTYSGFGRPRTRVGYPDKPVTVKAMVTAAGRSAGRFVTWRRGSRKTPGNPGAVMRSRFIALRVRPANRNITRGPDGSLPECWLLAEWPTGAPEPTDYWLSTLPASVPLRSLVRLAKIRWRIEHDYRGTGSRPKGGWVWAEPVNISGFSRSHGALGASVAVDRSAGCVLRTGLMRMKGRR